MKDTTKNYTSFHQKITLVFIGVGIFFVLIEILLRLSGFVQMSLQEHKNMRSIQQRGYYRIMCIGESTTRYHGKDSYPYQLEQVLNEHSLGIKFSVVNDGIPGITTDGLVKRLPRDIDMYKPDMVLAMMGVNDFSLEWSELARPFIIKKNGFLTQLRIFKLIQLIQLNTLSKFRQLFYKKADNKNIKSKTIANNATQL